MNTEEEEVAFDYIAFDYIANEIGCTEEHIKLLKGKIRMLNELKNTKATSFIEWFDKYKIPGSRCDHDELRKGDGLYYNVDKNILYVDDEAGFDQAGDDNDYTDLVPVVILAAKKFGVNCEYHHGGGIEYDRRKQYER